MNSNPSTGLPRRDGIAVIPAADIGGRAACADVDPETMFPLEESTLDQAPTSGEQAALAVCARCPIVTDCQAAVLGDAPIHVGVFGAMTAAGRRAHRAAAARAQTSPPAPTHPAP